MSLKEGQEVRIWDNFGRAQEGLLSLIPEALPGFTIPPERAESKETLPNGTSDMGDVQATMNAHTIDS